MSPYRAPDQKNAPVDFGPRPFWRRWWPLKVACAFVVMQGVVFMFAWGAHVAPGHSSYEIFFGLNGMILFVAAIGVPVAMVVVELERKD